MDFDVSVNGARNVVARKDRVDLRDSFRCGWPDSSQEGEVVIWFRRQSVTAGDPSSVPSSHSRSGSRRWTAGVATATTWRWRWVGRSRRTRVPRHGRSRKSRVNAGCVGMPDLDVCVLDRPEEEWREAKMGWSVARGLEKRWQLTCKSRCLELQCPWS